ncbi:MAG: phytanoyl-CoA dioxygenase family protein [Phycisphaeraceae bacterium]
MLSTDSQTSRHSQLKQTYDRDGYVIVRGLYTADQMAQWKQALRAALEAEHFNHPSGVRVWAGQTLPEPVMAAMSDDRVAPILEQLVGPNIEYLSAKVVFKDGKTSFGSPWHQDWFYWEGAPKMSVWIALDDATEANGCLTVIPGTHTRVFPRQRVAGDSFVNRIADADLAGLPIVTAQAQRGDAIFFHDLLIHGSHPNRAGGDRWSLISTYRDGSVKDTSTDWKTSLLVRGSSVNGAEA